MISQKECVFRGYSLLIININSLGSNVIHEGMMGERGKEAVSQDLFGAQRFGLFLSFQGGSASGDACSFIGDVHKTGGARK